MKIYIIIYKMNKFYLYIKMEQKLLNTKRKFIVKRNIIKPSKDQFSHFKEIIEESEMNFNKDMVTRKEKK